MKRASTPGEIGIRIRKIRKALGMNQVQFAKALRVKKQHYISRYELGRVPPPDLLLKIARIGNVTVDWIFSGQHPKPEAAKEQSAA